MVTANVHHTLDAISILCHNPGVLRCVMSVLHSGGLHKNPVVRTQSVSQLLQFFSQCLSVMYVCFSLPHCVVHNISSLMRPTIFHARNHCEEFSLNQFWPLCNKIIEQSSEAKHDIPNIEVFVFGLEVQKSQFFAQLQQDICKLLMRRSCNRHCILSLLITFFILHVLKHSAYLGS